MQYKYNTEIAPTHKVLTRTEKRRSESFRPFAQKWRTLATQVRLPLSEKELLNLLLKALSNDFYLKLVGFRCLTFSQLVDVGERIKEAMHDGRLNEWTSQKVLNRKEKDVEIAYIQAPVVARPPTSSSQGPFMLREKAYESYEFKKKALRQFTPLLRPLSKLLPMLLRRGNDSRRSSPG